MSTKRRVVVAEYESVCVDVDVLVLQRPPETQQQQQNSSSNDGQSACEPASDSHC